MSKIKINKEYAALVLAILLIAGCKEKPVIAGLLMDKTVTIPEQSNSGTWTVEEGIDLYHWSLGSGPSILTIHGGPGYPSVESWPAFDELKDRFTVHYYHQRGCGYSTRPIDTFETSSWPDNMKTLEEKLGIRQQILDIERIRLILNEDKLILVGHSFGGFIASLYAAEFPENVEKLILIAPAAMLKMPQEEGNLFSGIEEYLPLEYMDDYKIWMTNYFNYGTIWRKSEADLIELNNGMSRFFMAAQEIYYQDKENLWGVEAAEDTGQEELTGGWVQNGIYLTLGREYDLQPLLFNIKAKTFIFEGTVDLAGMAGKMYKKAIPKSKLVKLEDSGHFPQNNPQKFTKELQKILY